jgi:hypothetical protein
MTNIPRLARTPGAAATITPARSTIRDFYQSIPALDPPRTLREMAEIAAEEHAQQVAREGLH